MATVAASRGDAPFLAIPRDRGDEACEVLSPIAFKVWYRITRMTRGWNRDEALISYNDFMRACGLTRRNLISAALKELVIKGFIRMACTLKSAGLRGACFYALIDPTGTTGVPIKSNAPLHLVPTDTPVVPVASELVHQSYQNQYTSRTDTGTPVVPVASPQPAPQEAPYEPIETLIESVKETEEEEKEEAPTACTANAVHHWSQEEIAAQRETLRALLQQVRDLRHAGAPAIEYLPLQEQADELEATITHQTDLLLSDSQAPDNVSETSGLHESEQSPPSETVDLFTAISDALGFGTDTKHLNDAARGAVGKTKKQMLQLGIDRAEDAARVIAQARRILGQKFEAYLMLPSLPKYARQAGVLS